MVNQFKRIGGIGGGICGITGILYGTNGPPPGGTIIGMGGPPPGAATRIGIGVPIMKGDGI